MSEPKRRGRPPLEQPPARVHVSLRADDYDRVHQLARRRDLSVPDVIRQGVRRVLADDDDGDD
jgi:hypothetical protein